MIHERRAQAAAWGLMIMLVLLLLTAGLVDIYRLLAARSWAYTVAQEAALAGASRGRDFSYVAASGGQIRLDPGTARVAALEVVQTELARRGIADFTLDIRVLPDANGGTLPGFPPEPVRLGAAPGDWRTTEPSVGVYLEVSVDWIMLDLFNTPGKRVAVFAAAGVAH